MILYHAIPVEKLKTTNLYKDDPDQKRPTTHRDVNELNRILFWEQPQEEDMKVLILFDHEEHPNDEDNGTELIRNISLTSNLGNICKKYPDVDVTVPESFLFLPDNPISHCPVLDKDPSTVVFSNEYLTITKYSRFIESLTHPESWPRKELTLKMDDLFKFLLGVTNSYHTRKYRLNIPETKYRMTFLEDGVIQSIKIIQDENGPEITAEDLIEMSEWANRELKDLVTDAHICITTQPEPQESFDDPEPETHCLR